MQLIYLSPHLDDAVFSCGGLIWQDACREGATAAPVILTVCAGDPPPGQLSPVASLLHERWQSGPDAVLLRRQEDRNACSRLGAIPLHYPLPDCIYRRMTGTGEPLIREEADLFMPLPHQEFPLAAELADRLYADIPAGATLVSPIAAGGHIDHRLVRRAAEILASLRPDIALWYYADVPYVLINPGELTTLEESGWVSSEGEISPDALAAWIDASGMYRSQISSFWTGLDDLAAALRRYAGRGGGRLWRRPPAPETQTPAG